MSSEKTGKLGLHKWAPTDGVLRTEFNDNFGKIDEKVAEAVELAQSAAGVTANIGDVSLIPQATVVDALKDKDTKIAGVSSQLDSATARYEELNINISKYGAVGDNSTDNAPFINQALSDLKARGGGVLLLPKGYYRIKTPIVVSGTGVYLKSASAYKTRIVADSAAFVGNELIRFDQDEISFNKGIGIEGIYIDCNNVAAHGITVVNGYDQTSFRNVEVRNCNDNFINYNFIQKNPTQLGQTVLLENSIGEHYGNTSTKPVYYFERYQEMNLIGCKAFPNKANTTPLNGSLRSGDGFYFKDCRGVTLTGCSAAFGENAVVIQSDTRNVAGFTFVGQTHEQITGHAIKTINTNSRSIETITCLPIRKEGSVGKFFLDKATQCTLYTLDNAVEITSGSVQNTVFTTDNTKVMNNGTGNSIVGFANFSSTGFSVGDVLKVRKSSTPSMQLELDNASKKARLAFNASDTTDGGISLDKMVSGNYVKQVEVLDDTVLFKDTTGTSYASMKTNLANDYTGLILTYRVSGVNYYRQVRVGAADSGGTGFRQLIIPN